MTANKTMEQPDDQAPRAPVGPDQAARPPAATKEQVDSREPVSGRHGVDPESTIRILTAVIAVAAVAYTIVSFFQWRAMLHQGSLISDQLKVMHAAECPFIALKEINGKIVAVGQQLVVETTFVNAGRTPAFDLTVESRIAFRDQPLLEDPTYPPAETQASVGTLTPGLQTRQLVTTKRPLSQEQLDAVNGKQIFLYVYGRASYKDAAGRPFTMKFCSYYFPELRALANCPQHNRSD